MATQSNFKVKNGLDVGNSLTVDSNATISGTLTLGSRTFSTLIDSAHTTTLVSSLVDKTFVDALSVDAETLDGLDNTSFLRSDAADTKTSGDLTFNDNVKAVFGTGGDLEIYHDGSNSYVKDAGTGVLTIQSNQIRIQNAPGTEDVAFFNQDGDVKLYYNASQKLATTAYGATITGEIVADSATIASLSYPTSDGTSGQVLTTNGAGTLSFQSVTETDPSALAFAIALG